MTTIILSQQKNKPRRHVKKCRNCDCSFSEFEIMNVDPKDNKIILIYCNKLNNYEDTILVQNFKTCTDPINSILSLTIMKTSFLNLWTHWPEASRKKFIQYRIVSISITKASAKSTMSSEKIYLILQASSLY